VLPSVQFQGFKTLQGGAGGAYTVPYVLANAATLTVPTVSGVLDASGYNTLSVFVTFSSIAAGNTFKVTLYALNPVTGAVLAGTLGAPVLISKTANGSYGATLYLPSYYASLSADVMPFYLVKLVLSNTGGNAGNLSVDDFMLWLSNA
jgi:hypothetical protein